MSSLEILTYVAGALLTFFAPSLTSATRRSSAAAVGAEWIAKARARDPDLSVTLFAAVPYDAIAGQRATFDVEILTPKLGFICSSGTFSIW